MHSSEDLTKELKRQNTFVDSKFTELHGQVSTKHMKTRDYLNRSSTARGKRMQEDFEDQLSQEGFRTRYHIDFICSGRSTGTKLVSLYESLHLPIINARQHDIEVRPRESGTFAWILDEKTRETHEVGFVE